MKLVSPAALERLLPETLAFLKRLVDANSFTVNREGVHHNAELVTEQFRSLDFSAETVPAEDARFGDHLFLRRRGSRQGGLILITHLDTVYSPDEELRNDFRWREEGDRIYGPGVNDNKGGTAMIWLVLSALRDAAPADFEAIDWVVAANAAEEELPADFPRLCLERLPPLCRAALVFEACGGTGKGLSLVRRRKGSANFHVTVEGRGAHAGSRHHHGANAIVALAALVERIAAITDYSRDLTANVGSISGGGPVNRVPHFAQCAVNIRAFEDAVLQSAADAMAALEGKLPYAQAVSDGYPCRASVKLVSRNPAWPQNPLTDALIARWLRAAELLEFPLLAEARGGLSDGNFLFSYLPVLDGLGPFGLNGHSSEFSADRAKVPEFVSPRSFPQMGAISATAILSMFAG